MNADEFITAVKVAVRNAAVMGTISILANPPGRRPSTHLRTASFFFNSLGTEQRQQVEAVVSIAVDQAVFGFLAVLDGSRAFESHGKGRLELRYLGDNEIVLNSENEPPLHELYNS